MSLQFGILNEIAAKSGRSVALSPALLLQLQLTYPQAKFVVGASASRIFSNEDYSSCGIEVLTDISDCDVFIGIHSISEDELIPNKTYLFFLDLDKNEKEQQQFNRVALNKNCTIYNCSTLIDSDGLQRMRGLVGGYNALQAFGLKFELFKLPNVSTFTNRTNLITYLKRPVLPPIKITVIGADTISSGVLEIMKAMKIKQVSDSEFLVKNYAQAVFTLLPNANSVDLYRFTKGSDILIADSQMDEKALVLSQELLNSKDCKLRIVADLNPDSRNAFACTLRQSTTEDPFYGYLPFENREVEMFHPAAIVVVGVPSSGTELPQESSDYFGKHLKEQLIPAFFNQDVHGVLKKCSSN